MESENSKENIPFTFSFEPLAVVVLLLSWNWTTLLYLWRYDAICQLCERSWASHVHSGKIELHKLYSFFFFWLLILFIHYLNLVRLRFLYLKFKYQYEGPNKGKNFTVWKMIWELYDFIWLSAFVSSFVKFRTYTSFCFHYFNLCFS